MGDPLGRLHDKRLEMGAAAPVVEVESTELAVLVESTDEPAAVDFVVLAVVLLSVGTATSMVVAFPLIVVAIKPAVADVPAAVAVPVVVPEGNVNRYSESRLPSHQVRNMYNVYRVDNVWACHVLSSRH
jgi:hypothetical protein